MEVRRLRSACITCILNKRLGQYVEDQPEEIRMEYMQRVLGIMANASLDGGSPLVSRDLKDMQYQMFGIREDYTEEKLYFNGLMLELEPGLNQAVKEAADPLKLAIQYAMTGNYIDFGALAQVDVDHLKHLLDTAGEIHLDENEYAALQADLSSAKKLVYLTDNCGEVVADKVLIRCLKELYPRMEIVVVVRGLPVINDATMEDAEQIGLTELVRVIGNGDSRIAGTYLPELGAEAKAELESADLIISKGQGNFETLRECGLNIYYLFLCKCKMFAESFGVEPLTGMLINDKSL